MKNIKFTLLAFLLVFVAGSMQAQADILQPDNTTETFMISGTHNYYDNGGIGCDDGNPDGSYLNGNTSVAILCPTSAGTPVELEFFEVDIETRSTPACWDFLNIYDGNSTAATQIFSGCGEDGFAGCDAEGGFTGDGSDGGGVDGGPNDITGSNDPNPSNNVFVSTDATGCLTVEFITDGTVDQGGWIATASTAGGTAGGGAVPTMSQWGLFLFALVSLTLGMVFMYRMETEKAVAGMSMSASTSSSLPFNMEVFQASMKHALGLAVVGFAIILVGWGEIVPMDLVGMMISIPVVAYMIHIAKMMKK